MYDKGMNAAKANAIIEWDCDNCPHLQRILQSPCAQVYQGAVTCHNRIVRAANAHAQVPRGAPPVPALERTAQGNGGSSSSARLVGGDHDHPSPSVPQYSQCKDLWKKLHTCLTQNSLLPPSPSASSTTTTTTTATTTAPGVSSSAPSSTSSSSAS